MTIKPNRRYLVVPDLQIPLHHVAAVKNLIKMTKHEKFDFVLNVGDEMDMGSQSRWAKGTKLEFAETLDEERSQAQDILYDLGTTDIIRSNHTDRQIIGIAVGASTLIATGLLVLRWVIKAYLQELRPNGGSSMKDQLNRLETRVDELFVLISKR